MFSQRITGVNCSSFQCHTKSTLIVNQGFRENRQIGKLSHPGNIKLFFLSRFVISIDTISDLSLINLFSFTID